MWTFRLSILLVIVALFWAAPRPSLQTRPSDAGTFSPDRAAVIDSGLQRYVDMNTVAGIVALVLQDGRPVYEKAFGWADKEAGRRMTPDTLFRIASQTKALTSVAAMQLIEDGKLTTSTRVSTFIPSFANTSVAVRDDAAVTTIVPAKRQIGVRDLLTHTSGISYGTDQSVARLYEAKGLAPSPVSKRPCVNS